MALAGQLLRGADSSLGMGIISFHIPVWTSHLLNKTVWGTVSVIILLLALPASGHFPCCQMDLRPAGQTWPHSPHSSGSWFHSRPVQLTSPECAHMSPDRAFRSGLSILPQGTLLYCKLTVLSCPPSYLSLLSSGLALSFFLANRHPHPPTPPPEQPKF